MGGMNKIVYVSGSFVAEGDAHVRFDDRGFIFADGLYEVIRYYGGQPFGLDGHMQRLRKTGDQYLRFKQVARET